MEKRGKLLAVFQMWQEVNSSTFPLLCSITSLWSNWLFNALILKCASSLREQAHHPAPAEPWSSKPLHQISACVFHSGSVWQ